MNALAIRVSHLASAQHDVVAAWQLRDFGTPKQIEIALRGLRRVHRGVCALGDLTDFGWFMAAALAMGPTGTISHASALMLRDLRPHQQKDIHVSYTGASRAGRDGIIPHRRRRLESEKIDGIPVTMPTQSITDADLKPHELYRALEKAEKRNVPIDLPLDDVVRLKRAVKGITRSGTEARFILLCHEHGLPLPLVNHDLNGFETDFHWPSAKLVVEVDGFEHHRERRQFNTDRYRGLVHRLAGYEVLRVSADHVYDAPDLVMRTVRACAAPA